MNQSKKGQRSSRAFIALPGKKKLLEEVVKKLATRHFSEQTIQSSASCYVMKGNKRLVRTTVRRRDTS